ncbi:vWA domain-containing protein [Zavarzinia compransoris]|uniref:VWA domain-containing protein n=1 Tax=Zavarzinia compransoris TaxID=1264899 RepID=A0A317DVR9_9PROT|nr:VWA domain-containing protein [Zavarzinia compransoris]PWR18778.1 VWA domain-containing protein [Zavarzinia compransoris]TDP48763.1 Ca-activated chloride channel family protein [Zavarzinia compransoris]
MTSMARHDRRRDRSRLILSAPLALAGALAGCNEAAVSSSDGAAKPAAIEPTPSETATPEVPPPAPTAARPAIAMEARAMPAPMPPPPSADRFTDAEANPVKRAAEEPVSTFSSDVDTASYAIARRFLREGTLPPEGAVRVEEMINYFPYDMPEAADRRQPFTTRVAVMPAPWNAAAQLMTVSVHAMDIDGAGRPPLNLVLLVDVSGSMAGADRLDLVKASFIDFVRDLRAEDRIAIVTYAGGVETVLPPTAGRERDKIVAAIRALGAGGSTAGAAGMDEAYALARRHYDKDGVNRIILATDGDFNVGRSSPRELEQLVKEQRRNGIYLSVLGVGAGNLNDRLMQAIAQAGNGNAAYIDTALEGRKVLREEAASTLLPVADDVKFQVEFNPARVGEYRLIGYETRALRREDFNDDKVDAGDVGSGRTVTAIYEITPAGTPGHIDPLRYGTEAAPAPDRGGEIAFLRIRYKLPGEGSSRLIERPVTDRDALASLSAAGDDQRFQVAVAAFGQKLAGSRHLSDMPWSAIADLGQGARGRDPDGYRAEFVQLVRTADGLD